MEQPEIFERFKKVIIQVVGNDQLQINSDTPILEVPGWDSLNHINIIMGAEEEFGIRFNLHELEGLKTIGGFVAFIEMRISKKK